MDIIIVVGPARCGKTHLIKALGGAEFPVSTPHGFHKALNQSGPRPVYISTNSEVVVEEAKRLPLRVQIIRLERR